MATLTLLKKSRRTLNNGKLIKRLENNADMAGGENEREGQMSEMR